MLVFLMDEEEGYGLRHMYTTDFPLLEVLMGAFEELCAKKIAPVYQRLRFLAANSMFFPDNEFSFTRKKVCEQVGEREREKERCQITLLESRSLINQTTFLFC